MINYLPYLLIDIKLMNAEKLKLGFKDKFPYVKQEKLKVM